MGWLSGFTKWIQKGAEDVVDKTGDVFDFKTKEDYEAADERNKRQQQEAIARRNHLFAVQDRNKKRNMVFADELSGQKTSLSKLGSGEQDFSGQEIGKV
jgi:hypothetical protein